MTNMEKITEKWHHPLKAESFRDRCTPFLIGYHGFSIPVPSIATMLYCNPCGGSV